MQRLTEGRGPNATPYFFPDGQRIVFASGRDGRTWQLYTMDANGENEQAITQPPSDRFDPVVSHDGRWIAYEGNATGNMDIYVMPAGGGQAINLTNTPTDEDDAAFTQDDAAVVFTTVHESRTADIGMASLAAPGVITRVTSGPDTDGDADVSASGDIVFSRLQRATATTSAYDLYVTRVGANEARQLTRGPSNDGEARWTVDGRILFTALANVRSPRRIYTTDASGVRPRPIAGSGTSESVEPAPRPPTSAALGLRATATLSVSKTCKAPPYTKIYGTNGNDVKNGDGKRNCIWGFNGRDRLYGKANSDKLYLDADGDADYGHGGTGAGADHAWADPPDIDKVVSATRH